MMRALLVTLLAAACGGSPRPAATTAPEPPPAASGSAAPPAAGGVPTVAQLCARVLELRASGCKLFVDVAYKDADECAADLATAADDPRYATQAKCALQPTCEEVESCLAAVSPAGDGAVK